MKMRLELEVLVDVHCADYLENCFVEQFDSPGSDLRVAVSEAATAAAIAVLHKIENKYLVEENKKLREAQTGSHIIIDVDPRGEPIL